MQKAKTPHFYADAFRRGKSRAGGALCERGRPGGEVSALEFLNMASEKIIIGGKSLAGNVQDNGFCTQSGEFDYLLDMDDQPVRLKTENSMSRSAIIRIRLLRLEIGQ